MSNPVFIKCVKDAEGWWAEGKIYETLRIAGGCVVLGDDMCANAKCWIADPVEYLEDGSILYHIGGIEGKVLFEE